LARNEINLHEYKQKLKDLLKKDYWSTQDLASVLRCSPQRILKLADIYDWEFLETSPRMWKKTSLLKDIPIIFDRRLNSAYRKNVLDSDNGKSEETLFIEAAIKILKNT